MMEPLLVLLLTVSLGRDRMKVVMAISVPLVRHLLRRYCQQLPGLNLDLVGGTGSEGARNPA